MSAKKESVVIVGSGWAGYNMAQLLDERKYDITVISPRSTSPYTMLLASAACGLFDFSLAEEPVRHKGKHQAFYMATVERVDFAAKICKCRAFHDTGAVGEGEFDVPYDRLVLAPGCVTNTFGTPGAEEHAYFVRTVADARRSVQGHLARLLELASLPHVTDQQQRDLLHIVIVGGGPTGVEISAEMSDLFCNDLSKLYPQLEGKMRISIHDAAHHILAPFEDSLRQHAMSSFFKRNVQVVTDSKITEVNKDSITTVAGGKMECGMVIWVAGNKQCALVDSLPVAKTDKLPRILTDEYLRVLTKEKTPIPDVFALGDAADVWKFFLPTTAEVAVQKAAYLSKALNLDVRDRPFTYQQKALVAYIGGHDGVVCGKPEWTGPRAWAAWRSKNLSWTRSWRRKVMIMLSWLMNYIDGKEIARA